MSDTADEARDAALIRARAADWAAGASDAKVHDRKRAAQLSVNERLAEGLALMRAAEDLQASVVARRSA